MRTYTHEQVIELLRKKQGQKTLREFGAELGVSQTYIHFVLTGHQAPSAKLLKLMGLRKEKTTTITYFEATNGKRS